MEAHLTQDQRAFIREALETGRLRREEEDAVREAMLLWEERERRRLEILASVDKAETSLAHAPGRKITNREEVTQLADEVKRRRLARLSAEQNPR